MFTPSAPRTPHVTVVLLSYNQKDNTLKCIESFQSVTYQNFTVFLVDNASVDGTCEAIQKAFPSVHTFKAKTNLGCAGGRNFGAQKAIEQYKPEYLLFVDNDTVVEPDFIDQLIVVASGEKDCGIVTAKILDMKKKDTIDMIGNKVSLFTGKTPKIGHGEKDTGQYDSLVQLDAASSCCHLIPKDLWLKLGGYDTAYDPYGYEDIDICLRCRKFGKKILFACDARIHHKGTQTLGDGKYVRSYTTVKGRNMRRFLSKHAKFYHWIVFFLLSPVLSFGSLFRAIRSGDPKATLHIFYSFFSPHRAHETPSDSIKNNSH